MKKPKIILSDFDGTLTEHTEFSSKFLDILKLAKDSNVPFIIVTGRSISWAHFFLTHFESLNYVISEGGGSLSYKDSNGFIIDEYLVSDEQINWLEEVTADMLERFPMVRLSADSIGRKTDRAIELFDLKDVSLVNKLKKYLEQKNISFSTSNVHLNFWAGDISKYSASKYLLSRFFKEISIEQSVFFGDSLNDQTMFRNLENTVGVSNIQEVIDQLEYRPKLILKGDENIGPHGVLKHLQEVLS